MRALMPNETRRINMFLAGNRDHGEIGQKFGEELGCGMRKHQCGVGIFQKIGGAEKIRHLDELALCMREFCVDVENGFSCVLAQLNGNLRVLLKLLLRELLPCAVLSANGWSRRSRQQR